MGKGRLAQESQLIVDTESQAQLSGWMGVAAMPHLIHRLPENVLLSTCAANRDSWGCMHGGRDEGPAGTTLAIHCVLEPNDA